MHCVTVQDTVSSLRRQRSDQPEAYDFRRPMTLAREHGRILEMSFETFARQWGTQLTSRLRVVSNVHVESVEMLSYDDYVRALPTHTAMVLCTVEHARATAVVQIPVSAALVWVDHLLGGQGLAPVAEERDLTEIETNLIKEVLQAALADLRYAFAAVVPLEVRVGSVQYNPQFVQAASASDPVIVAAFELRYGESVAGATLMIPADVLLASLRAGETADKRTAEELREAERAHELLAEAVRTVPVPVAVRFKPLTVRPREVLALAVGDVLRLEHPTSRPLDVVVNEQLLARAATGTQGSRLACMVVATEEKE